MVQAWRPCRAAEPRAGIGTAAVLVLVFTLMGLMTRLLCADADGYSSFWPANAALLVALLRLRAGLAGLVLVCCFALNLALNRISGLSLSEGILACMMNILLVLLAAPPTRRFCGARTDLTRLRRQGRFGLIVLVTTAVEAAIGMTVERLFLGDENSILADWFQWLLCDSLGLMLATPAVLLLMNWLPNRRLPTGITVEPMVLMIGILLLAIVSFLSPRSFLFFFLYPALVTLAFRARPVWALSTVLFVSIIASVFTVHDLGPIARISPNGLMRTQGVLQPYLWTLFLSALPANTMVGEKVRYARRLRLLRAHLEHAATHDQLTGLMTRQLFKTRLAACMAAGPGGTLLFIDLDHFKVVNDTLGHQAGDTVLRLFSERMERCARAQGGMMARFGGDEFAMFLPRLPTDTALRATLAAILDVARSPYHLDSGTARLSVSIGGAALDAPLETMDEVIRHADEALYAAKEAGRDDFRLYGDRISTGSLGWTRNHVRQAVV